MLLVAGSFLLAFFTNRWWTIAIPIAFSLVVVVGVSQTAAVIAAAQALVAFSLGLLVRRRWWDRRASKREPGP